ncbi:competence protein CoiA [Neobacillus terrae]|uniref:competence protein CoiA n=1 Tax=Neobacillus terrae TaxID=3034837 RepID=UPI001408CBBD|nr:competence protein CoiA family protein [Neobacillus terrae]NHM32957.1 hypothetical protein [Neobacillus terrae]
MLTAVTKTGKKLCLGNNYKKASLVYFRNKEEFYCPSCGEKVVLKLGEKRIFHFSHLKAHTCEASFENETEYHLLGKKHLYQWLKRQVPTVEMEYYIKEIRQRPDIMFEFEGKKYALEYQCSVISPEIVLKRTKSYVNQGYIPIWLLGAMHFQRKNASSVSLSGFQYLFVRQIHSLNWTLPFYSPDSKSLIQLNPLFPYSSKNALADITVSPLDKTLIGNLIEPSGSPSRISANDWKKALYTFKMNSIQFHSAKPLLVLNELYRSHLNIFLLPPEIGIPLTEAAHFLTPPLVWQIYLYLDYLRFIRYGAIVSLEQAMRKINLRIKSNDIVPRMLPLAESSGSYGVIKQYLDVLTRMGKLSPVEKGIYKLNNVFRVPQNSAEQKVMEDAFYKAYWGIINDSNSNS